MSRVKRGLATKKRHKKLLKQTKGFWGQRKNIFRRAHETLVRAWAFAFKSRKLYKRDMRALFISRITAAVRSNGTSYSKFMHGLKTARVDLNRKMLSQLSILEPNAFSKIVEISKQ
ncbi:MAG TPA: 50S ribosomal protein L20 [Candidatus Babeliales bacterium]|jgi:large subunit ribosomal protein L20|nr:50S ribosomal protein L20 [Candidatus Babeliales bacterium]